VTTGVLIGVDLDGTIEDSRNDMVAAVQRVRAKFQLAVRADVVVRPHVNGGMEALYLACFDDYRPGDAERMHVIRDAYEADYLAHVAVDTKLYPGMHAALTGLARLGTLACVTNKPERISRKLLDELAVGELFATVVGGDSCAQAKPHRVMLETAALRVGFDPSSGSAFMIGDTNADMQLARAYGARAVWCKWGYVAAISETPDARAGEPAELVHIVSSQCAAL
jgi:phosphoglycolate phosphatase